MDSQVLAFLIGTLVLKCFQFSPVMASDPDPISDFNGGDPPVNFTMRDIFTNGDVTHGPGGIRAALNATIFPAMMSQGITFVQFKLLPCGINLPHTHPRATEMVTLVSGGPMKSGFVDTAGVAHVDILYPGDVTVFPRGMLHFEQNVGTEIAFFISALNSQNPGVLTAAGALFKLPVDAFAMALNQTIEAVTAINSTLYPYGPALQMSSASGCVPGQFKN
ncbi:hypothetical protein O6H91_03G043100 [Diphasiastrum complanatum]|uniref:Uncharacterized protein n=1 Tax=Diphasiastrum complanatum TaxID=34168 RepID=A0ACC2E5R7_DIPCM|nr:hypothetical protein O6H91_03G043100 [Diphasiastrum complanatum]